MAAQAMYHLSQNIANLCIRNRTYVCTRCKRYKKDTKTFSAEKDMDPGNVPPCLRNLSQVEKMLIARACLISENMVDKWGTKDM